MDLAAGIVETANALGMAPVDLATIISYETAGTFNPTQAGPTTQWGQHRGLIQFGEPQARQYGVDWNDPLGSQLGADGAIVRYYRQNGWQPGMGIMDAYSIVNAGGPGLYHRTDANNGGAPGTVEDKVDDQFGAHRENALRILGGDTMPPLRGPAGAPASVAAPQSPGITPEMISAAFQRGREQAQGPTQSQQAVAPPQIAQRPQRAYQSPQDALSVALAAHNATRQKRRGLLNG